MPNSHERKGSVMSGQRPPSVSRTSSKLKKQGRTRTPSDGVPRPLVTAGLRADYLRAFVMMPFGADKPGSPTRRDIQDALFRLLVFAVNDAYYQNYDNGAVRNWKPIKLERPDIGAGRSDELLGNVLLKIDRSDFCVVDFTHDNLNVALECGYALARDKFLLPLRRAHNDRIVKSDKPAPDGQQQISDLAGKLTHIVSLGPLMAHRAWKLVSRTIAREEPVLQPLEIFRAENIAPFGEREERRRDSPQGRRDEKRPRTFLRWYAQHPGKGDPKHNEHWNELEEIYRRDIVSKIYAAFRPLSEKLESGAMEVEYLCTAYASRDAANLGEVLAKAHDSIRILTTNLQGLACYRDAIRSALRAGEKLQVEILTLNPDSEFVNARGKLIGKEIGRFRRELQESLYQFTKGLPHKYAQRVVIKTYSEFPTQITFFIDKDVYSAAVSVNHQSRYNMMFKVPGWRKGVAESFSQHWDTIWARATEVR